MKKLSIIFYGILLINALNGMESKEFSKQINSAWHEIFGSQKPSLAKVSPELLANFGHICSVKVDNFNDQLWKKISSYSAQKEIESISCLVPVFILFFFSEHQDYHGMISVLKVFYLFSAYMLMMKDAYLRKLYSKYGDRMKTYLINEETVPNH